MKVPQNCTLLRATKNVGHPLDKRAILIERLLQLGTPQPPYIKTGRVFKTSCNRTTILSNLSNTEAFICGFAISVKENLKWIQGL